MPIIFILSLGLIGCSKLPSDEVLNQNQAATSAASQKAYINYINAHKEGDSITGEDIIFYHEEDIDLDGNKEAIIALGIQDDEDLLSSYVSDIYVLKNLGNDIKQIGDNLALDSGYGVYDVKIINLQNKPQKYIYFGLTNGFLRGFKILELRGEDLDQICYSASGTGSGDDELKDFNQDGQYDGYVQYRRSYDVLYFTTERTYVYKDNEFVLDDTWVDVPEYPSDPKEVIMQYLSLSLLEDEKSEEVTERLTKIFPEHSTQNNSENPIVPESVMLDTFMAIGEGLNIDLTDIGEGCMEGTISYTDEEGMKHQYYILLSTETIDRRWKINYIEKM